MDKGKETALLEWVNSLAVGPVAETICDLYDGIHFLNIIHHIDPDQLKQDLECPEERFQVIRNYLEDAYHKSLDGMVDFTVICQNRDNFEISKVCLLLLSLSLSCENNMMFIEPATNLDVDLQHEVKVMIESMIDPNISNMQCRSLHINFADILTRRRKPVMVEPISSTPIPDSNTPAWSVTRTNLSKVSANSNTPVLSLIQNSSLFSRFNSPTAPPNSPMSPVQEMVSSPRIATRIMIQQRDQRLKRLEREINNERHMRSDLERDLETKDKILEQRDAELHEVKNCLKQFNELKDEVDMAVCLRQEIDRLEGELERYKHRLQEMEPVRSQIQHLLKENNNVYQENSSLRDEVKHLQERVSSLPLLQSQLSQYLQSIQQLEEKICCQGQQMAALTEERDIALREVQQGKELHIEHVEKMSEMEEKLSKSVSQQFGESMSVISQKQVQELQEELDSSQKQIQELQGEYDSSQKQAQEFQVEVDTWKSKYATLETQHSEQQNQLDTLKGTAQECNSLRTQLQEMDIEYSTKIVGLQSQVETTQKQASYTEQNLQQKLREAQVGYRQLQIQFDNEQWTKENIISALKEEVLSLGRAAEEQQSHLTQQLSKCEESRKNLEAEMENVQKQHQLKLEACQAELLTEQEQHQQRLTASQAELLTVREQLQTIQEDREMLKEQITQVQSQAEETEKMKIELRKLKEDLEVYKKKKFSQHTELDQKTREIEALQKHINHLESDLKMKDQGIEEVLSHSKEQVQQLQQQIESSYCELQNRLQIHEVEKMQLQKDIFLTKQELEARNKHIATLEEQISKFKGELDEKTSSIDKLVLQNHDLQDELDTLHEKMDETDAACGEMSQLKQELAEKYRELQEADMTRDEEMIEMQQLLEGKVAEINNLQTQMKDLMNQNAKLCSDCENLEIEKAREKADLKNQIQQLTQENSQLTQELEDADDSRRRETADLKKQIGRLSEQNVNLTQEMQQQICSLMEKLQEVDTADPELQQVVANLEKEKGDLSQQVSKTMEQNENLEKQLKQALESGNKETLNLRQQCVDLTKQKESLEKQLHHCQELCEKEVTELKQEICSLGERKEQLSKELEETKAMKDEGMLQMQKRCDDVDQLLKQTNQQLQQIQAAKLQRETYLEQRTAELQEIFEAQEQREMESKAEIGRLMESLDAFKQANADLEDALRAKEQMEEINVKEITKLTENVQRLEQTLQEKETVLHQKCDLVVELEANCFTKEHEVKQKVGDLEQQLEVKCLELSEAVGRTNELELEKLTLLGSEDVKTQEKCKLQEQLSKAIEEKKCLSKELHEQIKARKTEFSDMRTAMDTVVQKQNSLQKQNVDLINQKQQLERQIEETKQVTKREASKLQDQLASITQKKENMMQELERVQASRKECVSRMQKRCSELEEMLQHSNIQIEQLQQGQSQKEKDLKDLQETVTDLQDVLAISEKQEMEDKVEISHLRDKLNNTKQSHMLLQGAFTTREMELQEVKAQFKEKLAKLEDEKIHLQAAVNSSKVHSKTQDAELDQLTRELQKEKESSKRYKEQVKDVQNEVMQLKQLRKQLNSQMRSMQAQLDHANMQLKAKMQSSTGEKIFTTTTTKFETTFDASGDNLDDSLEEKPLSTSELTSNKSGTDPMILDGTPAQNTRSRSQVYSPFSNATTPFGKQPMATSFVSGQGLDFSAHSSCTFSASELNRSTNSFKAEPSRLSVVPGGIGSLFSCAEEPEEFEWGECGRLSELQRRNKLCQPHLKTSYPVEMPGLAVDKQQENQGSIQSARSRMRLSTGMDLNHSHELYSSGSKRKSLGSYSKPGFLTPGVKLAQPFSIAEEDGSPMCKTPRIEVDEPQTPMHMRTPVTTPGSGRKRGQRGQKSYENANTQPKSNKKENSSFSIGFTPRKLTLRKKPDKDKESKKDKKTKTALKTKNIFTRWR